jgi:hypothetical protein
MGATQFRKSLVLSDSIRSAWLAVSADEGFEVVVNGSAVGQSLPWVTTQPYQAKLSEHGQLVGDPDPTINLNYPHEYQWHGQRGYLVPTFFDLAPYLRRGRNSVCIEVEARGSPTLLAEGEILLWSGERIRIDTDASFKAAERPPENGRLWTEPTYSDLDWPSAAVAPPLPGTLRRILDPGVFIQPFAGEWLRTAQPFDSATWFETHWSLERGAREAWVRVLSDREYQLFVNDVPVRVSDFSSSDQHYGEWTLGSRMVRDAPTAPDVLGPDETGVAFAGSRFASPPMRDVLGATERGLPPTRPPDLAPPKELDRQPPPATLSGYGIASLLHEGDNKIAVRVSPPNAQSLTSGVWPARIALDARATLSNGTETWLGEPRTWLARAQQRDGTLSAPVPAVASGSAAGPDVHLPRMLYRGRAVEPPERLLARVAASLFVALCALVLLAQLPNGLRRLMALRRRADPEDTSRSVLEDTAQSDTRFWMLVASSTLLVGFFLVYVSWQEREDQLLFLHEWVWRLLAAAVLVVATGVGLAVECRWRPRRSAASFLRTLPHRPVWLALVGAVLFTCLLLRVHAIAFPPWNDDEVASAQAAIAIAKTGWPKYSPDVYYTRSPLYHYLVGAGLCLFGTNVWALRLPTVFFATATALVMYVIGSRLLKSRWTGLIAAFLFAIHPYAIFVGHMARFYQPQQFFCLLTVYFVCEGLVTHRGSPHRARLLAVGSFFAACLTAEISVVLLPALAVVYFLFHRRWGDRQALASFLVASGCAIVVVVLDLGVAFLSGTRSEGISPNVEATLAFHFANPLHLITMFVSYSRLHFALSGVMLLGLPLLLRCRNRSALALLVVLLGGIVATNLLVTLEALRYMYWLFPVWLLLGVHAARSLVQEATDAGARHPLVREWLAPGLGAILVGAVLLSWSPWKLAGSYDTRIDSDSTSSLAYVRGHLREGDLVASTEPQPPASVIEVGRADYDIDIPLLNDYVYRKDGKLIDRNAGAEVISTLEQLEDVIARHDRLWVVVNRAKLAFRSRGEDVLWGYPGGRFEAFLRENFALKYQSFESVVFLWDAQLGRYRSFRKHGPPYL